MSSRVVFRQPLVYFVVLGVLVFIADMWLRREANVIRVTDGVRREVADEFTSVHSRAPTATELEHAVQSWTETELLFREANRLGLADNDGVIRNHLARKLTQMVSQGHLADPATEAELEQELRAHPDRYRKADTYTVSHAFVNRSSAPETFETRVKEALAKLQAGAPLVSVGDHFPRGPVFEGLTQAQLEAALNVKLSTVLKPSERGVWHQLSGARGVHFIRCDAMVSGEPTIENSRASLSESVAMRKKETAVHAFVQQLRDKFTVVDESKP